MIGMKTISKFILAILAVSFMTTACDDMNSIIQDDLDKGEAIYPGRPEYAYDRLEDVHPGIGNVWLYWTLSPDSRVDSTVIIYTFNGETKTKAKKVTADESEYAGYRIDSLQITGLDEGYYSFSVYTVDKDGHRSITSALYPQIVRVYGDIYLNSKSPRIIDKTEMLAGGNLQITWTNASSDVLYSLVEYKDHRERATGETKVDTVFNNAETSVLYGFKRFQTFKITSYLRIGIDTAPVEEFYASPVVEKVLLSTAPNRFTEFTAAAAEEITELTFPVGVESWTLQDLYYFPKLRTLDLTPGTTGLLPELTHIKSYTDRVDNTEYHDTIRSVIGGDPWLNFASGYMADSDMAIMEDLLESGQLTTVKYTRNSYPKLDAVLERYPAVRTEWNPAEPLPDDGIMIPYNLLVDYRVVDRNKGVNITNGSHFAYAEDGTNVSGAIAGKFTGGDLRNVYRVRIEQRANDMGAATNIAFEIPSSELQINLDPNGRLKFDCYIESPSYEWLGPAGISKYEGWKKVKVWCERTLPGFTEDSPYQEADFAYGIPYRANSQEYPIGSDNKGFDIAFGDWTPCEWDLTPQSPGHYRVIRMQFGADGAPWGVPNTLTYYIANLRWSK
jgi:hypothetical protein